MTKYKKKANGKNATGRPDSMTPETIARLEDAFLSNNSDEEACLQAGVSTSAFYRYCEAHPKFRERKELLKKDNSAKAKKIVRMAILNNDVKAAMWWLERKEKAEFGNSTKLEIPEPVRVYVKDYEYDEKVLDHIDAVTGDGTRKENSPGQK